ncbi:hypothetical protein ACIO53_44905 [Streptomyces sp. NPDC087305]|uniref:hypothetical protein n=1 Tax=Streptomyces sp. NPDC087305 TaxID=3365781 RepID=UPI003809C780
MLAGFAGHPLADLPSLAPETVTTDHGFVYRNRYLVKSPGDSKLAYVTTVCFGLSACL